MQESVMPYIQIRYTAPNSTPDPVSNSASSARLGAEASRLMAELMGKRREVTVVEVVQPASAWFLAGAAITGSAAYVDIKITQGTNSVAQKAHLLAEFQRLLETELGPLTAPAYVVIHEIPASDWGYDGLPQASRLAANQRL
jgi:4-oxalocrotonate tautomerase